MPEPISMGAAAVLAGGSILGQGLSSALGASQAEKQMRFQERMSSTAHQREVEDLRKAGLNPILSAKLGGSSSPPGAMGQVPDFGNSAKTGIDAMRLMGEMGIQQATVRDINAAADLKDTQRLDITNTQQSRIAQALAAAQQSLASGNLSDNQARQVQQTVKNLEAQLKVIQNEALSSSYQLAEDEAMSRFWKGPFSKVGAHKKALGLLGIGTGSASSAKSWQDETLGWMGEYLNKVLQKGGVIK